MRAYVIGNAAIDENFRVERLPGEGESILAGKGSVELGGKGANQAVVLARAGLPTTLIAGIGSDTRAERVRGWLAAEPLEARLLPIAGASTDLSIILADGEGANVIVTTVDCARALTADAVLPDLAAAAPGDLMVLQGNLGLSTTRALIAEARARAMRVVFNPSPVRDAFADLLPQVDTLFLNQHEAGVLSGREGAEAVRALLRAGPSTVVLTLGREGALLGTAGGVRPVPAVAVAATDSTGAGDTFQSVALVSAARRGTGIDAAALRDAARAAAITVTRRGTLSAFPTQAELEALLA
ncbi:PfkB family carbohydrate kinase [Limimaricola pyoseonensis]|uniref:Ribokinase n=1 Tax=Limimaricola pyoseonensis TaxID=521013 RepID=A0A1G7FXX3_9RHOB|nr:PfkB family carbohydrate kinase [Limimaricola pyoseonensis]SDE80721.1 ribokinase [Limimaricola pyoseonensis]